MGASAPPWWCPICLKIRFDKIPLGINEATPSPMAASFGLMVLLQEYQNKWGIGDYRIDSADADSAMAAMVSGDTCTCDPYLSTLNRNSLTLR